MSHPRLHLALDVDPLAAALRAGDGAAVRAAGRAAAGPQATLEAVAAAENAGFTLITVDDALLSVAGPDDRPLARIDAVTRAAHLALATSRIGLAPVVHPAVVEPFHLAAQLASLDHASTGRAAWVAAAGPVDEAARALGRAVPTTAEDLAREEGDVVGAARDLWDSWEDDAVIRDVDSGRYIDRDRLHYVDVRTPSFSIKGPLIVPRPPQGQVAVLRGVETARAADAFPDARSAPDVALLRTAPGADGRVEVAQATAALHGAGVPVVLLDVEISLTAPATGPAETSSPAPSAGVGRYAGGPAGLVDLLRGLAGIVDGVRLLPADVERDLDLISRHVTPALLVDRLISPPLAGSTLRRSLGLPRPAHRFAHA